jgi:hypothetical protein
MYHTLVPQYERMALRREYRLRSFVVLCFALSIAGIVGIVTLFPAFLLTSVEEKSAESDLLLIKKAKDVSGLTAIQQKVASSQSLLSVLSTGIDQYRLSVLIEEIVAEKRTVKINSLALSLVSTSTVNISIEGIAPTRDTLLAFKSRLLSIRPQSKVDLPVSGLAKSTNIPFSIQMTQKLQ